MSYITNGVLVNVNVPKLLFMLPPSDDGYNYLKNIQLYIIICHDTREYLLCTLKQLLPFLHDMHKRWKTIFVYSYTGPWCLMYYNLSGYNFAFLNQQQNEKYICDPDMLKNGSYNMNELKIIMNTMGLPDYNHGAFFSDIKNKKTVEKYIYDNM